MRPVNPEIQLILIAGIKVVVERALALAANPSVADEKVSARTQAHENVIVEVAIRNDVFEAELESWFVAESFLVRLVMHRLIEKSSRWPI